MVAAPKKEEKEPEADEITDKEETELDQEKEKTTVDATLSKNKLY